MQGNVSVFIRKETLKLRLLSMFFTYRLAKNKRKYLKYSWELYPLGLTPITIVERRRTINNVKKKKQTEKVDHMRQQKEPLPRIYTNVFDDWYRSSVNVFFPIHGDLAT